MLTTQHSWVGGEVEGSDDGATEKDGDALGEDVSSKQWKNPVPLQQVNIVYNNLCQNTN